MTHENFDVALEMLLERRPFKQFTISLFDGTRFEIDYPHATVYRPGLGKAVFASPGGVLISFDHDSVSQIIDAPASIAPGKNQT